MLKNHVGVEIWSSVYARHLSKGQKVLPMYPPSVIVDEKGWVAQLWPAATEAVTGMAGGDPLGDGDGVGVCPIQSEPALTPVGVPRKHDDSGEHARGPVLVDGQKFHAVQPLVQQQASAQAAWLIASVPPLGSWTRTRPVPPCTVPAAALE